MRSALTLERILLLHWIFLLSYHSLLSQPYSSHDNFTGAWETPASWNPTWAEPQTTIFGYDITINGYITLNSSLTFTGTASTLIVNDTLVIRGNLTLGNNNDIMVNDNGILIVRGNLIFSNQSVIQSNGYFIVTGDLIKDGAFLQGTFNSNDNPVKVFICGTINPVDLTANNPDYPVLNCSAPTTIPYPNSDCSYGNMTDVLNDPIHDFLQSTCTIATPTITADGPTSFCAGGSVTLTSSAGLTYLWSTGATTASINVTTAGSYTVRVIEPGLCQSAESVASIVAVYALPATPTITADGPTTFCEGNSVTLTSSAAAGYLWSNAATTRSIDVNAAGSYSVKAISAEGCESAFSAITPITVNALPVVNAGTDATIPNGTNTTIDATLSGIGPFSYSWSPSGQLVDASIEDPTTVNLAMTTVFTLTAISSTTTCSGTDEVTITISGGPLLSTPTAIPATICAGENVQLHALAGGGSGSYTYSWTAVPVGFTSSVADPVVNPTVNTTYYVAVSDGFNTVNTQVLVTVKAVPAIPTITPDGPTTFCDGDSVGLTSSAGTGYLWSNGETTQSIHVTTTGIYSVSVTNATGCQSAPSSSQVVTVNATPVTPTITTSGPTTFCYGGSVTLTSSAGTDYLWSNGETTQSINVTVAGSYSVSIISAGGCKSAASAAQIVMVNDLPGTPTITPPGPLVICEGTSEMLKSNASTNYLWSTGETTPSIDVTAAGSYTVRVTDVNGCQSAPSAATVVDISPLPSIDITSSDGPMCADSVRTLTASPSGGTFVVTDGPGIITGNILSATGNGIVNLEYNYTSVCTNKASQSITVNEIPVANAGPDQELAFIFKTQMNAELLSPETGEWSLLSGSGVIGDIHDPTATVTELSVGENKFLWTVGNGGCEASDEVIIKVADLFVPSVITPNNDGKNDYFKIGLSYENAELVVFNRWGIVEYSRNNYANDWDGRNNNGTPLSEDTYFYVLKFNNGEVKRGSVLIVR